MTNFELLPTRAVFHPDDEVTVEVRALAGPAMARVLHLGEAIAEFPVTGDGLLGLGALPVGGYGIEVVTAAGLARTAIEVQPVDARRMRYGFVVDYRPGRDIAGFVDNVRRLHLTDVLFYDWAYRHADLLGGGELYDDALDQPISLDTVRQLVEALHGVGSRALGYAAVYAVGADEWPSWQHAALLTPSGKPYALGDFVQLVDPAEPEWLRHFTDELCAAADQLGFDGFHLDQYGYPKHASRPDGTIVTLENSFALTIAMARAKLPAGRLVFNNVNDFPTWRTRSTAQDAIYVEVWPPHTTLGHLADLVDRAHDTGNGKPVVIAAYQHVYDSAPVAEADRATAFTMATLFSHRASHLLCGEADRILVDPYYVRNHVAGASTAELLKRWYDFDAEHAEVLYNLDLQEMTGALAGEYNADCDVRYDTVDVAERPTPGAVWRRIVGTGTRLVVHLINLTDQDDTCWDAPRKPITSLAPGTLRVRRGGPGMPRVRFADPDQTAHLTDVTVRPDGDYAVADLPPPHIWQLIVIDL